MDIFGDLASQAPVIFLIIALTGVFLYFFLEIRKADRQERALDRAERAKEREVISELTTTLNGLSLMIRNHSQHTTELTQAILWAERQRSEHYIRENLEEIRNPGGSDWKSK